MQPKKKKQYEAILIGKQIRFIRRSQDISERVFEEGRHAVLLQESHRHETRITLYATKSLNAYSFELRECKNPMKSALS
jgi:hypothetical protein